MIDQISIKNFKCYSEQPAVFDLAPITFIFGDNSSGKSTFLQLLEDICIGNYAKFTGSDCYSRNNYNKYVFKHENNRDIEFKARISLVLDDGKTLVSDQPIVLSTKIDKDGRHIEHADRGLPAKDGNITFSSIEDNEGPQSLSEVAGNILHIVAPRPAMNEDIGESGDESLEGFAKDSTLRGLQMTFVGNPALIKKINELLAKLGIPYKYLDELTLLDTIFDVPVDLPNLGTGIQALANICLGLSEWDDDGIFSVEEPEAHINEKQIGALTKLLVNETRAKPNRQLIVECHSELMARALQVLLKNQQDGLKRDDVSFLYVTKTSSGSKVTRITLDSHYNFTNWPGQFFPVRSQLQNDFLGF